MQNPSSFTTLYSDLIILKHWEDHDIKFERVSLTQIVNEYFVVVGLDTIKNFVSVG